jgi:DNA-3-methyladenine glycosylase II
VSVRSLGTVDAPRLELQIETTDASLDSTLRSEVEQQVAWILGTDQDVTPFHGMARRDRALCPLVEALRGLHLPHTGSVYEALVLAILGQQVSSHVARIIRTLVVETYGRSADVSGVTYHAFPHPETMAAAGVAGLRAVKLSTRKAEYITGIATRVASGEFDLERLRHQSDEEVVDLLRGIRGVGLWTAQWLLIRAFGRTDGFPHGDLALRRSLGTLVNAGRPFGPHEALEYSRRWAPFRSYVTTYLFAAVRSGRFRY